jgi:hypothetical protein
MWNVPCFGIDTAGYFCFPGSTWMFRPTANTWTNVNPAAPPGTYIEERKWVISGKGYVTDQAQIWQFDPATFQWTSVYSLPSSGFSPDVGFAIGSKAYLMDNYYQKFYEYDPVANTLTQKAVCPLNNTVGVGFGLNGKGYCGTGYTITQVGSIRDMAEYDPVTDTWKGIDELEGSDRRKATSFVIGTKGYITCGSSGINMNDLWEFDPNKITGMDEAAETAPVDVYPNPSRDGKFRVSAGRAKFMHVYNAGGELLQEISFTAPGTLNLSGFENGIYFISFLDERHQPVGTKKVVLQK